MGGAVEETWKLVLGQIRANGGSVQGVRDPRSPVTGPLACIWTVRASELEDGVATVACAVVS